MVTNCGARKSFFGLSLQLPESSNCLILLRKSTKSWTDKVKHNSWKSNFKQ